MEDGRGEIAGITLTPCISRREEKTKIVAVAKTVGNSPASEATLNCSLQPSFSTFLAFNHHDVRRLRVKIFLAVEHRLKYVLET